MAIATSSRSHTRSQLLLTLVFALALSLLTFAASFADAPRSEFMPNLAAQR